MCRMARAADGRRAPPLGTVGAGREYVDTADKHTRIVIRDALRNSKQGTTRANSAPKFCRRFSRVCPNYFDCPGAKSSMFSWGC